MKNFLAEKRDSRRSNDDKKRTTKEETTVKRGTANESLAYTDLEDEETCALDTTMDLYDEFKEQEEEARWEAFCAHKRAGN